MWCTARRQKLLKKPLVLLPKVAAGVSRSALFLASYIALTFGGECTQRVAKVP